MHMTIQSNNTPYMRPHDITLIYTYINTLTIYNNSKIVITTRKPWSKHTPSGSRVPYIQYTIICTCVLYVIYLLLL